ncbi:MAG: FlgD immunoglobulin-like domain containing protein [Candidatus Eisenbacteria bacterium]
MNPASHTNDAGSTEPLGIEVQQTTFATAVSGPADYTILSEWKIVNKGGQHLEDAYVGIWTDPDLGGASDDFVGCDPEDDFGFCYNATNSDNVFGSSPPAVGIRLVQGPVVPSPGDTAYVSGAILPDYRNLPMTAFLKYINGTDPNSPQEVYNYLRGLDRDGSVIIDPTTGEPTTYMVSGDPITRTGWVDSNPSDRRMLMVAGPLAMEPGDEQTVAVAVVVGAGSDRLDSLVRLRENAQSAVELFRTAHGDPSGACCTGSSCRVTVASDCTDGTFLFGETCDPNPCDAAVGACCWSGSCYMTTEAGCLGEYLGDGSVCTPDLCDEPGPLGACCLGTECQVLVEAACQSAGGSFYPDLQCPPVSPGNPRGWQHNDRPSLMVDEIVREGGVPVPPDSHGGPGNDVWHSYNSTSDWLLSAGGGDGGEGRFTRDGADLENLTENHLLMRWDGRDDNIGWWAFDNGEAARIPFGLYERNAQTGLETRLIPVLFSGGGTAGVFDLAAITEDPYSGFPGSDWCYAYRFDPAVATYEEFVADAQDGQIDDDPTTVELFSRLIVASEFGLPGLGTVIEFSTNPSGIIAGSGFDGAVPLAWSEPEGIAPCFDAEYEVLRDGVVVGSTARTDFLDTASNFGHEYQVRAKNPMTGEVGELHAPAVVLPRAGGFSEESGIAVTPPDVDGVVGADEWADATEIDAAPFVGGDPAEVRVMHNRDFLFLAFEDAVSAEEVRVYIDANDDGVYGPGPYEGVVILDHGQVRFQRLSGVYPNVSELEEIVDPGWALGATAIGSAELRLARRGGPLAGGAGVSLFVHMPSGSGIYPRGPESVLSQAPSLFAEITLPDVPPWIPSFSDLPVPFVHPGEEARFEVAIENTGASLACVYRTPGAPESGVAPLQSTGTGGYRAVIPGDAVSEDGVSYRLRATGPDGQSVESREVLLPAAPSPASTPEDPAIAAMLGRLETMTCFPNPFAAGTTIAYRMRQQERVSVTIYDVGGARVRSLLDREIAAPGVHVMAWDGRDDAGRRAGSGTFFVRVQGETFAYRQMVTILR